jgi:hypothetical protein
VRRGFLGIGTSISAVILASALAVGTASAQPTTTTTTTPPTTTTTQPPTAPPSTTPPSTTPPTSSSTTTTSAPTNPTLLLDTAIAAFQLERGAQWSLNWSLLGKSESLVVHDGQADGTEAETLNAGGPTAHLSLDLDGKLYVEGDANGLGTLLNFKASAAKAEAGHWVGVPRSAAAFASWAVVLTVESAAYTLELPGSKPVLGPITTVRGQSVVSISQSAKSEGLTISQTDYLRASGTPLPVEIVENADGLVITVVFGAWGKPPHALVHKAAVPFLKSWLAKS